MTRPTLLFTPKCTIATPSTAGTATFPPTLTVLALAVSDHRSDDFAGHVGDFVYQPSLNGGALTPTPRSIQSSQTYTDGPNCRSIPSPDTLPRGKQLFNFAALTPAVPAADREYLYGSLDRKIYDQYLELFADFKYVRTFWDGALVPASFTPDVFTDATHPFGISSEGISVPLQNPFNPFTSPSLDDKGKPIVVNGIPFTTGVHYAALEAGVRTDKITTHNYEFTGGLRGNLGEFGDYFKTWQWESGFRYSEDDRTERISGQVDSNALRAALLDTNPATAFNPFGLNQNSPAVINKVFVTTQRVGKATLTLEDLKVTGNLCSVARRTDLFRDRRRTPDRVPERSA